MYLDIHREARTNGEFAHRLQSYSQEIARLENSKAVANAQEKIDEILIDIYRLCKYNPGFLVPYFFPAYPFEKPLSLNNRPYSFCMFHFQIGGYIVVRASRQIGKALEDNEPVLTPDGWLPIGYAQPGMVVYDGYGERVTILGVYPQGYIATYRMLLDNGTHSLCCEDHLWNCRVDGGKMQTLPLRDLETILAKGGRVDVPKMEYENWNTVISIEKIGLRRCTCITVDSPDSTFVTRDMLVTHNSTSFAARQLINAHVLPKYRSMYIAPHMSFLDTYANRVREMERAFRFYRKLPDFRQNLKYKEYPNGAIVYMVKCLTDSQEARSKTADELLFDEAQLLDSELLPDIEQCQKASRMPINIYAGTSTTVDTLLETKYQSSSQGVWFVRASGFQSNSAGKGWVNCGDEQDVFKCLSPKGFMNPANGRLMNVRDGEWVHQNTRLLDAGFVGFHIPQVIIPEYVEKPLKWRDIMQQWDKYSEKKFMHEVLGIPTEEGQREITLNDIKRMCDESLTPEDMKKRAQSGAYRQIVSGCDWGGSDYNPAERTKASYTVHAMMGIRPDDGIDILMIKQYSGMAYREIIDSICRDHKEYCGRAIATDFGVGGAYNLLLRENDAISPERHFIFAYAGPNTRPIAAPPKGWFNQYTINRTDSITAFFTAIKSGQIRCYSWAHAGDRLLEFLNMFRVPVETAGGQQTFRYMRHGAKPDDSLHACNFAHILTQIMRNKQFVEDIGLRERINSMLGLTTEFDEGFGYDFGGVISG